MKTTTSVAERREARNKVFADRARAEKSRRLAAAIVAFGYPAAHAEEIPETLWMEIAETIGVRPPSGATIALTVETLKQGRLFDVRIR